MNAPRHDRSIAINAALSTFLDPQQTDQALELWREKYATQSTFSVQYFVRECCALLGVESLRNQLVQSLVLELNSQRMQVVTERTVSGHSNRADANARNEVALQVFQLLFQALADSAGPLRGREISRYVAAGLPKMSLAKDVKRSLEMWLNRDMPVIEATLPIPVLVTLVNRAYVGLCEYCGPVKADQMLHACVSRVAETAAGQQFHPQQLL
jgi:hypothetical protein